MITRCQRLDTFELRAKMKWNHKADQWNQWGSLSQEEQAELIGIKNID